MSRSRDEIDRYNKEREAPPPVCAFCSKGSTDVAKMIASPNGLAICNECVDVCNDILADGRVSGHSSRDSGVVEHTETLSFKCPGCGRKFGIRRLARGAREPESGSD